MVGTTRWARYTRPPAVTYSDRYLNREELHALARLRVSGLSMRADRGTPVRAARRRSAGCWPATPRWPAGPSPRVRAHQLAWERHASWPNEPSATVAASRRRACKGSRVMEPAALSTMRPTAEPVARDPTIRSPSWSPRDEPSPSTFDRRGRAAPGLKVLPAVSRRAARRGARPAARHAAGSSAPRRRSASGPLEVDGLVDRPVATTHGRPHHRLAGLRLGRRRPSLERVTGQPQPCCPCTPEYRAPPPSPTPLRAHDRCCPRGSAGGHPQAWDRGPRGRRQQASASPPPPSIQAASPDPHAPWPRRQPRERHTAWLSAYRSPRFR